MKLLEKTNKDNFQTYLTQDSTLDNKSLILKILLSNVISRLKSDIQGKTTEKEFENKLSPNLTFKVIKLNCKDDNKTTYIANLNQKGNLISESNTSIDKVYSFFNSSGINFSSKRVLESRLSEINFSEKDPVRLKNVDYEIIYSESLQKLKYEDLEKISNQYEEFIRLYDHREYIYEDKVRSVFIQSINKNLENNKISKLNDEFIESLIKDIPDDKEKERLFRYIKDFVDFPNKRKAMIEESDHILKTFKNGEQEEKVSTYKLPIWKLIIGASAFILTYVGIKNIKNLSNVWKLVKEYSSEKSMSNKSKVNLYFKLLFSKKGRKNSKIYILGKKTSELGKKTLDKIKKEKALAKYRIKSGSMDINNVKKYLDGIR